MTAEELMGAEQKNGAERKMNNDDGNNGKWV